MIERLALKPVELAEALNCSRAKAYDLIASGEIPTIQVGADRRVTLAAVKAWMARQEKKGKVRRTDR